MDARPASWHPPLFAPKRLPPPATAAVLQSYRRPTKARKFRLQPLPPPTPSPPPRPGHSSNLAAGSALEPRWKTWYRSRPLMLQNHALPLPAPVSSPWVKTARPVDDKRDVGWVWGSQRRDQHVDYVRSSTSAGDPARTSPRKPASPRD